MPSTMLPAEARDERSDEPSLSILLTSRGPSRRLERTLRSLAEMPEIESAELLIGLHGRDGLVRTRELVELYLPSVPTRLHSMPRVAAGVARAAITRLAVAPLLVVVQEGATIDRGVLDRASAALGDDDSLLAAGAGADSDGGDPTIVLLRRDEGAAPDLDPLQLVRAERSRMAVVPLPEPAVDESAPALPRRLEGRFARSFPQLRPSLRVRALLVANVCAAAFYLSWWLEPGHVGSPILFAALATAEGFNLLHLLGLWWTVWTTRADGPPVSTRTWSVDVFVTTCGEPLDVLRRTVAAAVALDGEHRTFVLDDANRREVRRLARRLGAEYVRRPTRAGAKAGNLNHALARTDGELVAVFDADHVPYPDFLQRLTAYFEDPELAFVQTPQFYANAHHDTIARGAYQQQAIFYGPICRGKSGVNAAFCCGTNVLFRRRALADVGGFDEQSVVEDFVTSMHLHRRGWRSVYYPYVLSEGLGPDTLHAYFRQQFRWARGSIGALVSLEPFRRGYTLAQRAQYLLATTFYLMGLVTSVYVALPILYLLGGWSAFSSSSGDFVLYYLPYLVLGLVTVRWGLGGKLRLEHLRYTFGAFPVYAAAAFAAFARIPARFTATGASRRGGISVYALVSVGAFALTQLAIVVGLWIRPLDARTFTNVSWALVNVLLLSGIAFATFERRRAAAAPAPAGPAAGVPSLPEHALAGAWRARLHELLSAEGAVTRVAALTAFGLALRLAFVGFQSIRLDESVSLSEARLPLGSMIRNLFTWDVHPPLYYTLLHLWVAVAGTSEIALRLPSVVFGTAAVPLLYLVARRLTSERGATFAAALGAASPFWVWHSDEARMYTFLLALSLAALWRLFVACERNRPRDWVVYGLVTGISLYTHYFAALMLPVHACWILLQRPPRRVVRRWLAAVAVAVALLAAWLTVMVVHDGLGGVAAIKTGVVSPSLDNGALGSTYAIFLFLFVYVLGYVQGFGDRAGLLGTAALMLAGSWPLIVVAGVVSRRAGHWLRSRAAVLLGFWIVSTVGAVYVLNLWKGNVWMQRYLIIVSPALFILLGIGLARVVRPLVFGTAVVVAALSLATVAENYDHGNQVREDWRGVAAALATSARPGDAVAVLPWFYVTPLEYYVHGRIPVRGALLAQQSPLRALRTTLTAMARAHAGHDLWVATAYESVFDPRHTIRSGLARTLVPVATYELPGQVVLRRYRIPATGPRTAPPATGGGWWPSASGGG